MALYNYHTDGPPTKGMPYSSSCNAPNPRADRAIANWYYDEEYETAGLTVIWDIWNNKTGNIWEFKCKVPKRKYGKACK